MSSSCRVSAWNVCSVPEPEPEPGPDASAENHRSPAKPPADSGGGGGGEWSRPSGSALSAADEADEWRSGAPTCRTARRAADARRVEGSMITVPAMAMGVPVIGGQHFPEKARAMWFTIRRNRRAGALRQEDKCSRWSRVIGERRDASGEQRDDRMPWQVAPGLVIIGGAFSVTGGLLYLLQGLEVSRLRPHHHHHHLTSPRTTRTADGLQHPRAATREPEPERRVPYLPSPSPHALRRLLLSSPSSSVHHHLLLLRDRRAYSSLLAGRKSPFGRTFSTFSSASATR